MDYMTLVNQHPSLSNFLTWTNVMSISKIDLKFLPIFWVQQKLTFSCPKSETDDIYLYHNQIFSPVSSYTMSQFTAFTALQVTASCIRLSLTIRKSQIIDGRFWNA